MKILVVGGSGRVGRRIVSELQKNSSACVSVADRVAPESDDIPYVEIDLSKPETMTSVFGDYDLVVNSAGPFDRWGTVVLDAAIETKTDYLDVCDDPEPTIALLERSTDAEAAGIRAVVGLGVSPGLTNFLAVAAAKEMDTVDRLVTFWGDSAEGRSEEWARKHAENMASSFEAGRAAYTHLIIQASAEVPVWKNGAKAFERAWKRAFRVTTSAGETGSYRVIGHPEPVTVPHTVNVNECLNIGTVNAGTDRLMLPILERVTAGEVTPDEALHELAASLRRNPEALATPKLGDALPRNIGAAAVGTKDGEADGYVVFPAGPVDGSMSLETARPAVVGALNIKEVPSGVHAPEAAFDADRYMKQYSEMFWDGIDPFLVDRVGAAALKEED